MAFNGFDLSTIQNCYIGGAAASAIYLGNQLIWPISPYAREYFSITSLANNNTISWHINMSSSTFFKDIKVSTDDGATWTTYTSSYGGTTLATLNNGDKLLIKGNNTTYSYGNDDNYFSSTGSFKVEGNIMSLIYEDNFAGKNDLTNSVGAFHYLFKNCTYLVDAGNLLLPATILGNDCYARMFQGCTSLTNIPALPANTLSAGCYMFMFKDCTSLTTAPVLNATVMKNTCYAYMFEGCTSLTTAPALPSLFLDQGCYRGMFKGCTSLTTAPALPASNYISTYCYREMFYGCTSLTTAPDLPATRLYDYCYYQMFESCTSLNYVKCLATDISATYCTWFWLGNVSSTGTFVKDANMTGWSSDSHGIPSGWTVQNA